MGRPPCCEKTGVKKGPWSPEEDLLLVSYVLDHGPGNWRVVPANTGLMRCSKSCRLRWTNYLRPGIKRGNFSDQEEKLIIELQQLLGNRWSAIAAYMPERTDNDIKNYWNTHLKKRIAKTAGADAAAGNKTKGDRAAGAPPANKGQWERRLQADFHTARQAFQEALSSTSTDTAPPPPPPPPPPAAGAATIKPEPQPLPLAMKLPAPAAAVSPAMYAYSVENIARLLVLEGWTMRPSGASGNGKAAAVAVSGGGGGEGGSGSHGGTAPFAAATKVEGAGGAGAGPSSSSSSFPMLESWLLDDGMAPPHGDALADPCEFF